MRILIVPLILLSACGSPENWKQYCDFYDCVTPVEERSPFMQPRMKAKGWIIREEF